MWFTSYDSTAISPEGIGTDTDSTQMRKGESPLKTVIASYLLPGISTLSIQEGKKRTIEKREIDNVELFTFHRSSDQLCGISAHIFAVKEKKKGPKKKVKIENGKKNKPQKQKP